jgi:hypothetical protein
MHDPAGFFFQADRHFFNRTLTSLMLLILILPAAADISGHLSGS